MTTTKEKLEQIHLVLIGCGSMGGAMLQGWIKSQTLFASITVSTPNQSSIPELAQTSDIIKWHDPNTPFHRSTNETLVFCLAVKPNAIPGVLSSWRHHIQPQDIVSTVAAGLDLITYEEILGIAQPIVRIMPNTPSTIQQGMSLLLANASCTKTHQQHVEIMMQACGEIMWVETDDNMDRLTAISGCGPAFLFAFTDALKQAALDLGCPEHDADLLAKTTVLGSANYMTRSPKDLKTLISDVASPGGMTAQGLAVLDKENRLKTLMLETTKAAYQQAAQLKT